MKLFLNMVGFGVLGFALRGTFHDGIFWVGLVAALVINITARMMGAEDAKRSLNPKPYKRNW